MHKINLIELCSYVQRRTMQLKFLFAVMLIMDCGVHTSLAQNWQNCQTPRRTTGLCVPPNNCEYVLQLQANYGNNIPGVWLNFLSESRCFDFNTRQNFICCDAKQVRRTSTLSPPPTLPTPPSMVTRPPYTASSGQASQSSSSSSSSSSAAAEETIFTSPRGNYEATLNANGANILRSLTCGVANTDYISFGNKTKLAEYPWVALLRYDVSYKPFKCGGSLISNRYVVTAAHCTVNTQENLIGVRLGEHDLTTEEDCVKRGRKTICYRAEDFGIERIFSHPDYNRYRFINDIALIKMDRDVVFKKHIQPICLPVTNAAAQVTQYPDKYIIAGWGTTETGETANVMLKAELLPQTRTHCQSIFRRLRVGTLHICAGGENRVDSCKGDSGGPLFATTLYEHTARFVLYGVVSFGVAKCGDENSYPGVYVNVVEFMPWLTNNILY